MGIRVHDPIEILRVEISFPSGHCPFKLAVLVAKGLIDIAIPIDLVGRRMNDVEQIAGVYRHLAITLFGIAQRQLRALTLFIFLAQFTRSLFDAALKIDESDTGGIGGTLAGNALSLAAMRATLESVLTDEAYAMTIPLARRFAEGVAGVIAELGLPWHVSQLGCRAEYWFRPTPPRNGSEAAAAIDPELDRYMHLAALNRGILMTPFHNMALISPQVTEADIDRHTAVFREIVGNLVGS